MDPNFRVNVKSAPSAPSPDARWAAAVVIMRDPAVPLNGFLQMLKPNGQTAWIPANMVKISACRESCPMAGLVRGRLTILGPPQQSTSKSLLVP
jgi:hypothetical protein